MKRVVLRCPICFKQNYQIIASEIIELREQIETGIVLIEVPGNLICEHSFFLEVDKNFAIRNTLLMQDVIKLKKTELPHYISLKTY